MTRADKVFLAALVMLGAGLRLYGINTSLWYDEIVTLVESVRAPLGQILTRFAGDNHHPLYSVLAHLSVAAFGEEPWALRLPAVMLGVGTIPLLYLLGRQITNRAEAGAAALILTVSYHHVWFSQNARGYTAVLFCVLLSTYALVRWLEEGSRRFVALFAVSTALGSYAHLTTVLVAIGQAGAVAIAWIAAGRSVHRSPDWKSAGGMFVAAAFLTVLCYGPMLRDVGAVMTSGEASGGDKAGLSWTVAAVLQGLQVGFGALWGIALGAVVFGAGVVSYLRQRPAVALLFALPVVVTVAAALLLDRPVRPRFLFFSAGFALLFTVRGAAAAGALAGRVVPRLLGPTRPARTMVALLTLGAVALSIRSLPYGYRHPKQDYGQAVEFVERSMQQGDVAVAVGDGAHLPIARYLHRPWTRVNAAADVEASRPPGGAVWVVSTFPSYIESGRPDLWRLLQNGCRLMHEVEGTVEDGTITVHRCP